MFRFLLDTRRKRLTYSGVAFISHGKPHALIGLMPYELVRGALGVFLELEVNAYKRLNNDWGIGRVEGGDALVVFTPLHGLDADGYAQAVKHFMPVGYDIGHCPWPWLDDPFSVLALQLGLRSIARGA